ncbi:PREDICTED: uncharacterized protein LOC104810529 [Tarenaya hassleriana]|uniref:uncharacterized protein LOC104810529 n=1 Tax=Tarenaya hassleriana TaxID=28532 RepID=UPI00053C1A18|nr:PREDICTED: uncharacterized protein LOC104810529 [Tarenaya hassleriana]
MAEEEEESTVTKTTSYLRAAAEGRGISHVESLILHGLEIVHVGRGILRCNMLLTDRVSDGAGNWSVGARAAAMDTIGAVAVYSDGDGVFSSVDFNCSFYSTAKIQEEVEMEAKVVGRNGSLKSAKIEIRRKGNGDLVAMGRLWMTKFSLNFKSKASYLSKL